MGEMMFAPTLSAADFGPSLAAALRLPAQGLIAIVGGGGKTSAMRRLAAEVVAQNKRVICTATTRLRWP